MNATTALANFVRVQEIFSMLSVLDLTAHMWPKSAHVEDNAKYDFVIVGGGTAGCVVATRLAEVNKFKVLLIEAGGDPPFESLYPAYFAHLKHTKVDYNVTSVQEKSMRFHKGKVLDITQGIMLGGSSSLNYLAYARGLPMDYDHWANITNDSSWSYKNVLPLLIKNEKLLVKEILDSPEDRALHGTQGKFQVIRYCHSVLSKYFSAYKEMGIKVVKDINENNLLGVQNMLFSASKTGRQSTARSFLSPMRNNGNLDVMKEALVTQIIFDENKNAISVKVRTNENKIITVNATKEIIVTAGVFKTPQLLMVSGIGPRKHLESKNIEVIADLPVGQNLQDHPYCISIYRMGERRPPKPIDPTKFVIPRLDGYYALKESQKYPDYYIINLILDSTEEFLVYCTLSFSFLPKVCDKLGEKINGKQIYTVFNELTYPKSRGYVLLNTTDMEDQPLIKMNYYEDDADLNNHADSVLQFNAIANTSYFKSVDAELLDPELKDCEGLDKNSREYWKCYCFAMVTTSHFLAGTCPMGIVVDAKLFVKGVKRLRIADASIMPRNVASGTAAPVIMIAQKAADMILKKHSSK